MRAYRMPTDYFQTHNTECDICKSPEAPDATDDVIAKLRACDHVFHHHCIVTWLSIQINRPNNPSHGTCPMCRSVLIVHPAAPPERDASGARDYFESALENLRVLQERAANRPDEFFNDETDVQARQNAVDTLAELQTRMEDVMRQMAGLEDLRSG